MGWPILPKNKNSTMSLAENIISFDKRQKTLDSVSLSASEPFACDRFSFDLLMRLTGN